MTTLVSAHRAGSDEIAGPAVLAAVDAAVALGVDLVEVDVRRRADGVTAVGHDHVDDDSPILTEVIDRLGERAALHLDLKDPDPEAAIVAEAVAVLGADRVVVTTNEDADVPAIRAWAATHAPGMLVGLSTSRRVVHGPWTARIGARVASWFPRRRMRRSGADLVVAHHLVARWWLARWASRRGLPILVWTVDEDADLRRWLNDPRATIVTTNRPARALELRRAAGGG